MDKINLYWFKKKEGFGNFGDELGPYIIAKLSGKEISAIIIPRSSIKLILAYVKGLFFKIYTFKMLKNVIKTLKLNGNYIISVGSIIGWGNGPRIVWGSGILFKNEKISNGTFLAVRGKYTQQKLIQHGYQSPDVVGDPALLLPKLYTPQKTNSYEIGLVPHHTQYNYFKNFGNKHKIKVINLLDRIEDVINDIYSCKRIISTSLHGLIVAHAYGIPSLWYEYSKIKWRGENIKFLDYLSSVNIPEYSPFRLKEIEDFNIKEEINNFEINKLLTKINTDLTDIQNQLISVAPFDILSQYKS